MQSEVLKLNQHPAIIMSSTVVGRRENEGPLADYFDYSDRSDSFGQNTFEKSESEMQHIALNLALSKSKLMCDRVDAVFAGDLINQCTSSSYGLQSFNIPYFGLYGACSTAAESLMLSSLLINAGYFKLTAAVSSSHYCSAERQFRFPLEYGGQRPPTSQWTVTGAAAFLTADSYALSELKNSENQKLLAPKAFIIEVLPGKIVDFGITDANNMGAAMAPAAADTLNRYFNYTKHSPDDFDLIVTGDLGFEGYSILKELMSENGFPLGANYNDCGLMIYNREKQDMHSGGSGCGCSAVVLAGYILDQISLGKLSDVLFIGTGALMSPASVLQGQNIPGIAHLIRLSAKC